MYMGRSQFGYVGVFITLLLSAWVAGCNQSDPQKSQSGPPEPSPAAQVAKPRSDDTAKAAAAAAAATRERVSTLIKQLHTKSFARFRDNMGDEDIRFALSGGEAISDSQVDAVRKDLTSYYQQLPVASTVQVPVPQSDALVAFERSDAPSTGSAKLCSTGCGPLRAGAAPHRS
jgi:hypothetical protein